MSGDGNLSPWAAIPFFDNIKETTWNVFPSDNRIVQANQHRVGLIFSANGTQPVRVSTQASVNTSTGILVPANGVPLMLTHSDWGYLVQVEWYGVPTQAGATVCVIEVMLAKWPEEQTNAKAITPTDIKRAAMAYARARQVFAKQSL